MEIIDCTKCINQFYVGYNGNSFYPYCKLGIKLHMTVTQCPHHKPKVDVDKMKDKIKEEQKHVKRIGKQRERFDIRKRDYEREEALEHQDLGL